MVKNQKIKKYSLLLIFLVTLNCSKSDPITGEKVLMEPDPVKRAKDAAEKGGGIFGDFNRKSGSTTFEFASSNVLWRATLKSLDFLPLRYGAEQCIVLQRADGKPHDAGREDVRQVLDC